MGSYWLYLGIIFAFFAFYLFIHWITDTLKPIRINTKNVSNLTAYFLYIGFLSLLPIMIYAKSPRQLLHPLWSLLSPRWADKSLSSHRRISIQKDHCIVFFWLHGSIQWWFKEGKANSSIVIIEHCTLSIGSYKYCLLWELLAHKEVFLSCTNVISATWKWLVKKGFIFHITWGAGGGEAGHEPVTCTSQPKKPSVFGLPQNIVGRRVREGILPLFSALERLICSVACDFGVLHKRRLWTSVWVVRHSNRLPREVVDVPFLGVLKARWDGALSKLA